MEADLRSEEKGFVADLEKNKGLINIEGMF